MRDVSTRWISFFDIGSGREYVRFDALCGYELRSPDGAVLASDEKIKLLSEANADKIEKVKRLAKEKKFTQYGVDLEVPKLMESDLG